MAYRSAGRAHGGSVSLGRNVDKKADQNNKADKKAGEEAGEEADRRADQKAKHSAWIRAAGTPARSSEAWVAAAIPGGPHR